MEASTDSPYTKEVGDTILKEESVRSAIPPETRSPVTAGLRTEAALSLPRCASRPVSSPARSSPLSDAHVSLLRADTAAHDSLTDMSSYLRSY